LLCKNLVTFQATASSLTSDDNAAGIVKRIQRYGTRAGFPLADTHVAARCVIDSVTHEMLRGSAICSTTVLSIPYPRHGRRAGSPCRAHATHRNGTLEAIERPPIFTIRSWRAPHGPAPRARKIGCTLLQLAVTRAPCQQVGSTQHNELPIRVIDYRACRRRPV